MANKQYKDIYHSMLEDYFGGRIESKLADKIRNWLPDTSDPVKTDRIMRGQFEKLVNDDYDKPSRSTQEAWKKISLVLGFAETKYKRSFFNISLRQTWMKVAAVMLPLLLISGVYLWFRMQPEKISDQIAAVAINYSAEAAAPEDAKKRIYLPDGTEVMLNAGSRLGYDTINYSVSRNIRLHGEAYFSVARDENIPFIVDAGDITVMVLGTDFNIKTSENDGLSEVSLFSGSVEVRTKDRVIILEPNQQLLTEEKTGVTLVKEFDKEAVSNWRLRLDLDNVSLPKAFSMIGDHFGMPVVLTDTFPEDNRVRVFFKEATIDETMDVIQMITRKFEYKIESDTLKISAKK